MKYFGIKSPEDGRIWWIAEDSGRAWDQFFQHVPSRSPMYEAVKAYEAIGYRCVELEVKELEPPGETELDRVKAELTAVQLEREAFGSQLWELAERDRDCRALLREAQYALLREAQYASSCADGNPVWAMGPSWRERAAKLIGK